MEPTHRIPPVRQSSSPDIAPWVVALAALGAILFLGVGWFVWSVYALTNSGKDFVDVAVPAIATSWSQDELSKRESPEFRRVTPDDKMAQFFEIFRKLGPMTSYDGAATVSAWTQNGLRVTGRYLARITCQNGKAEVVVSVIKENGEWQILGFRVNSDVFVNSLK
jgi:hypothetical protein